jgi:mannosyltransferase OCH1-like enzyme
MNNDRKIYRTKTMRSSPRTSTILRCWSDEVKEETWPMRCFNRKACMVAMQAMNWAAPIIERTVRIVGPRIVWYTWANVMQSEEWQLYYLNNFWLTLSVAVTLILNDLFFDFSLDSAKKAFDFYSLFLHSRIIAFSFGDDHLSLSQSAVRTTNSISVFLR